MLKVGRNANLAQKTLDAEYRAELWVQHLEGDTALMSQIAGEIHRRHAAVADFALDGIASNQRRLELIADHCSRFGRCHA